MLTKSQFWLALICLLCFYSPLSASFDVGDAQANQIIQSSTWRSLLHLHDGQPQIKDPNLLLSQPDFSVSNEFWATINLIKSTPSEAYCRFPARYMLLTQHLDLPAPTLDDSERCSALKKYQQLVPFDQMKLIFASEVLSSAASMMGHTFISADGLNSKGNQVAHSISFFTELDSLNIAKLLYDGVVAGMEGFFLVRPYRVDFERYIEVEGRNIWSYTLDIDEQHRELIKHHIWELKDIEIEYLFQSYNCATLTLYLLAIAEPELKKEERLFVSPMDVVKAIKKHQLIADKKVTLADDWAITMLRQQIDGVIVTRVEQAVYENTMLRLDGLSEKQKLLAQQYLALILKKEVKSNRLTADKIKILESNLVDFDPKSLAINMANYKMPEKTPQDSQLISRYGEWGGDRFVEWEFLPASHQLTGDNRQYFSESELKIAAIKVRTDLEQQSTRLHQLTLYQVKSFIPTSDYLPRLSGAFHLGYRHIPDADLNLQGVLDLSGAFGRSYRLTPDVMAYGMLGMGVATDLHHSFAYLQPHAGLIVDLIADSKLLLEHKVSFAQFEIDSTRHSSELTYAWFARPQWNVEFSYQYHRTNRISEKQWQIGLNYLF